ncbi:MAG TPA: CPCC family cysteine-rich protein, partial [Cytophaga sp.]|nr:CPCC family cysteine-rich protein [Cytophaga sp.]
KVKAILDFFRKRRTTYDNYISQNGLQRIITTCKSCGFPTLQLHPLRFHEICDLCNWQDDIQDDHDADKVYGGPNYISLTDSRIEFGLSLDENGFNMNASIIQKPEIILSGLKEYVKKMQNAESINKKSDDDFDRAFLILRNKLIEKIFKNPSF